MTIKTKWAGCACFLLAVWVLSSFAEDSNLFPYVHIESNRVVLVQDYESQRNLYGNNQDWMIRPGLVASRSGRTVRVLGEYVGLGAGDPLEFILISGFSGHDYEAVVISAASPGDIQEALQFIGLPLGQPVNYEEMRLWPRGEPLTISMAWNTNGLPIPGSYPIRLSVRQLLENTEDAGAYTNLVFSFVGSPRVEHPTESNKTICLADLYDPGSIVSLYNEPSTVVDVGHRAPQSAVYGSWRLNPEISPATGQLVSIIFEPVVAQGRSGTALVQLNITRHEEALTGSADLEYELLDVNRAGMATGHELQNILAAFERLHREGRIVFVRPNPDVSLRVSEVRDIYTLLSSLATDTGIRIEPPAEGHLFYKAFLPRPSYRSYTNRPSQVPEIRLAFHSNSMAGVYREIEEEWFPGSDDRKMTITNHPFASPEELADLLAEDETGVVVFFVSPALPYGKLLKYAKKVNTTHPVVYVFLEEDLCSRFENDR